MDEFYKHPPRYNNIRKKMYSLKSSSRAKVFPFGKSVLGRGIFGVSIGNPQGATLLVGGFHSLEWHTILLLFKFIDEFIDAQEKGALISEINPYQALLGRGVIIVPCLNPDGLELVLGGVKTAHSYEDSINEISCGDFSEWQANIRGVDLNHNFNAGWETLRQMEIDEGIIGPSPRRFGGFEPESEPETRTIVSLCKNYDIRQVLAFHSQGEEIYYDYGENTPEKSRLIAEVFSASSGYMISTPEEIASHGGFKDWFIEYFKRPGFTIEIGKGQNPLPIEQFEEIYERLRELLVLSVII